MRGIERSPGIRAAFARPQGETAVPLLHGQHAQHARLHEIREVVARGRLGQDAIGQVGRVEQREGAGHRLLQAAVGIVHHVVQRAAQFQRRLRLTPKPSAPPRRAPSWWAGQIEPTGASRHRSKRDCTCSPEAGRTASSRVSRKVIRAPRDLDGAQRLARHLARQQRHSTIMRAAPAASATACSADFGLQRAAARHAHLERRACPLSLNISTSAVHRSPWPETRQRRLHHQAALHFHRLIGHAGLMRPL
jgi:hypothetical protein